MFFIKYTHKSFELIIYHSYHFTLIGKIISFIFYFDKYTEINIEFISSFKDISSFEIQVDKSSHISFKISN